jgi:hypothetical protein
LMQRQAFFTGKFCQRVFGFAFFGGRATHRHHIFAAFQQAFQNRFAESLLTVKNYSHN